MKKIYVFIWLLLLMACGTEGTEKGFVTQQAESELGKAIQAKINTLPKDFESCRPGFKAENLTHFSQEELNSLLPFEVTPIPGVSPSERYLPQVQPEPCQIQPDTIEEIFFFALMHPEMSPELLAVQAQKHPTLKNDNILNGNIFVPCGVATQHQRFIHPESVEQTAFMKIYADIRLKDQRQYRTQAVNIFYIPRTCLINSPTKLDSGNLKRCEELIKQYGSCGIDHEAASEICRTTGEHPLITCPESLRQEYLERNKATSGSN